MKTLLRRCLPFALILAVSAGWCVTAQSLTDQPVAVVILAPEED